MIEFDEAMRRIAKIAHPTGIERVPIAQAAGRVVAAPVHARTDAPPVASSAMDGYALRSADLPGPLTIIGESFAGCGFDQPVEPGQCVRIFTGAPVPAGADRVIIQEQASRAGAQVNFPPALGNARHIRAQASDFAAGDLLLPTGTLLTPRAMVAAAAADRDQLDLWRQPRVRILATGDELAPPGEAHHQPGRIAESVSFGVAALASEWGARVMDTCRLPDAIGPMRQAATAALEQADLIVVTGGASVGERDFAKAMFDDSNMEILFAKVAIKPGKPVWLGKASGRLILGLPGNPTSAMVTARLFLAPLIAGMSGRGDALNWQDMPLAAPLPSGGERMNFLRARHTPQGAMPLNNQDSSAQHALIAADLLLCCAAHGPARQSGELVRTLVF